MKKVSKKQPKEQEVQQAHQNCLTINIKVKHAWKTQHQTLSITSRYRSLLCTKHVSDCKGLEGVLVCQLIPLSPLELDNRKRTGFVTKHVDNSYAYNQERWKCKQQDQCKIVQTKKQVLRQVVHSAVDLFECLSSY